MEKAIALIIVMSQIYKYYLFKIFSLVQNVEYYYEKNFEIFFHFFQIKRIEKHITETE